MKKVSIVIGDRDPRRGDFEIRSGLVDGDKVIRNPISTLVDGQKVNMVATAGADLAAASATAASASATVNPQGK
ncbi:MAG: hypothetical protein HYR68_08590 [Burkholderiales bacterium]|nr:hypothetical protein [Burkholderiales bacterium]